MPRKSEAIRTFTKKLQVALTDEEMKVTGKSLALAQEELEEEESDAKDKRSAMRERKKELTLAVHTLAETVRNGTEERDVECFLRPGKRDGFVEEVRKDTGEVLDTRRIEDKEAQIDLLPDGEPELDA